MAESGEVVPHLRTVSLSKLTSTLYGVSERERERERERGGEGEHVHMSIKALIT